MNRISHTELLLTLDTAAHPTALPSFTLADVPVFPQFWRRLYPTPHPLRCLPPACTEMAAESTVGGSGSSRRITELTLPHLITTLTHPSAACCSPKKFFHRKDRTMEVYPDPFPGLEHESAEINGVRWAQTWLPLFGVAMPDAFVTAVFVAQSLP